MFDCLSICTYVITLEKIEIFLFMDSSILLSVLLEMIVNCFTGVILDTAKGGTGNAHLNFIHVLKISGLWPPPNKTGS